MRILLNVERGFIEPISYKTENEQFARNGGNIGNKVFTQAIYNMLNIQENTIELVELNDELEIVNYTIDEINEQFDLFVFATVIFGVDYVMRRNIQTYTRIVKGLKIPVFCFSVGTQIESYDNMNKLIDGTKDVATEFISSVIKTNGYMALRGYFTKEYFDRLGFKSFEVTGCPSMFQNGREFSIEKKNILVDDFRVSINGNVNFLKTNFVRYNMKKYKEANYLDQDEFVSLIYGNDIQSMGIKESLELFSRYSYEGLELFANQRVKMICNFSEWKDYFRNNQITFSFGSRIHGNIIAILSKVPSMVCYCDSRTREMAEFFNIPSVDINSLGKKDLYELYSSADYSKFNNGYGDKLENLDRILSQCDIPHDIDCNKAKSKDDIIEHYYEYENMNNMRSVKNSLREKWVLWQILKNFEKIRK